MGSPLVGPTSIHRGPGCCRGMICQSESLADLSDEALPVISQESLCQAKSEPDPTR